MPDVCLSVTMFIHSPITTLPTFAKNRLRNLNVNMCVPWAKIGLSVCAK